VHIVRKKNLIGIRVCAAVLAAFCLHATAEEPAREPPSNQSETSAQAHESIADTTLPQIDIVADSPRTVLRQKNRTLDEARDDQLLPKFGAASYDMDQEAIDLLPQGKNTPIDKVLLQAPGVSYDSAVSNPDFHVRNEYANVQYRINGIQLPDGVSGLGPVLETGFIGKLNLLDGALPAQYGLRTAGVIDITTRSQFTPGGSVDLYGGSHATISPSIEAGGSEAATQFFLTARYLQSEEGLESATPGVDPLHDRTSQVKFFGYGSTLLDASTRLTYMGGISEGHFQIPNAPGLVPLGDYGPENLSSANLDEHETDRFAFGIVALQAHRGQVDGQFSLFTRYASISFIPDLTGDLVFNNVASEVSRRSLLNGMQYDGAWRAAPAHTLRAGLAVSAEQTYVVDLATVLPVTADGQVLPQPLTLDDKDSHLGWNYGGYLQDEWRLGDATTINTGVRFDQMRQFVSASQWSPRVALVWRPSQVLSLHAGYARYFTPPMQAQATPTNLALFRNTTQQPSVGLDNPLQPERADYVDVGVDFNPLRSLTLGADVYAKRASDQLDDGQFGQAVVLTQFNYAHGFSRGVESKIRYEGEHLRAYGNVSLNATRAKDVVSNQYLFTDPVEFAYLASHYIYTDDDQQTSASVGFSYRSDEGTTASLDGMLGSGLRMGFANLEHVPGYTQWNAALARGFTPWGLARPLTARLSVINLFDRTYLLRSGTGIGEFAPQFGPRRAFFLALTQVF